MADNITVKRITDDMYLAGSGRSRVRGRVKGTVYQTVSLDRPTAGEYEIPIEIDLTTADIEVDSKGDVVEVTLWVS